MNITVIGAGYVGLVAAVCFACGGHQVTCLEKDADRCGKLSTGQCPILEKDLPQMLRQAIDSKKMNFTTSPEEAIPLAEIIFITVGTPADETGKADLGELFAAASIVGQFMRNSKVVVIKSSVPPGTTETVREKILNILMHEANPKRLHVAYNPEFLREGSAVEDFLAPDRIIVGADDWVVSDMLFSLYRSLLQTPVPEIFTSPLNAELIKYASNSYLAVRLSFVNELAGLCEKIGGSISEVTSAMGLDHRIGREYLLAGLGYGGACLPKDTCALAYTAREACMPLTVLESAIAANSSIVHRLADRVARYVAPKGIIAVWGLSFKAGTEDIRNSQVLLLMREIAKRLDCRFQVFDPAGGEFMDSYPKELWPLFCRTPEETVTGADALIIGTAWPQFRELDLNTLLHHMRGQNVFDFVNALDRAIVQQYGLKYHACGEM